MPDMRGSASDSRPEASTAALTSAMATPASEVPKARRISASLHEKVAGTEAVAGVGTKAGMVLRKRDTCGARGRGEAVSESAQGVNEMDADQRISVLSILQKYPLPCLVVTYDH